MDFSFWSVGSERISLGFDLSVVWSSIESLSGKEFPELNAAPWKPIIPHGEGCLTKGHVSSTAIRAKDFISPGIFRIAKREEREWRKNQVEEIKALLFKSPQPNCMKEALEDMHDRTYNSSTPEDLH
jgi:hypothetical protein